MTNDELYSSEEFLSLSPEEQEQVRVYYNPPEPQEPFDASNWDHMEKSSDYQNLSMGDKLQVRDWWVNEYGTDEDKNQGYFDSAVSLGSDAIDTLQRGIWDSIAGIGEFGETFFGIGEDLREYAVEQADANFQEMTPEARATLQGELLSEGDEELWGEDANDPRVWLANGLQVLSSMVGPIPMGGIATKGMKAAVGLSKTARALVATGRAENIAEANAMVAKSKWAKDWLATTLGYGSAEGVVASGMAGVQVRDEIEALSDEQVIASPFGQEMIAQGVEDVAEIKEQMKDEASKDVQSKTFLPTMALGAGAGRFYDKALPSANRIWTRILQGGATEGLEEAPQSAVEQYAQNVVAKQFFDPERDEMSGVGGQAILGGIFGAGAGGAIGAVAGRSPASKVDETDTTAADVLDTDNVNDAIAAANEAVGQAGDIVDGEVEAGIDTEGEFALDLSKFGMPEDYKVAMPEPGDATSPFPKLRKGEPSLEVRQIFEEIDAYTEADRQDAWRMAELQSDIEQLGRDLRMTRDYEAVAEAKQKGDIKPKNPVMAEAFQAAKESKVTQGQGVLRSDASETISQPLELPSGALTRPNGNVILRGDAKKNLEWAKKNGIKAHRILGGVQIPRSQMAKVISSRPKTIGTVLRAREEAANLFGRDTVKELEELGILNFYASRDEIPEVYKPVTSNKTQGFYDPDTRKAHMIADQMRESNFGGVLLHELGEHAGLSAMMEKGYDKLQKSFDQLLRDGDARATQAHEQAVKAAPEELYEKERMAYFIEQANERDARDPRSTVREMLDKVKAWFVSTRAGQILSGRNIDLTDGMMLELAKRAVRFEVDLAKIARDNQKKTDKKKEAKAVTKESSVDTKELKAKKVEQKQETKNVEKSEKAELSDKPQILESLPSIRKQAKTDIQLRNDAIRMQDKTVWVKAKELGRRWMSPGGNLPRPWFDAKIERDAQFGAEEHKVNYLVRELERAAKTAYGKSVVNLTKEQHEQMMDYLTLGEKHSLPEGVRTALAGFRNEIDRLSLQYLESLLDDSRMLMEQADRADDVDTKKKLNDKARMFRTIAANIGKYMHRSYQAFDDPKWASNVPDDVVDNARNFLRKATQGSKTEQELDYMIQLLLNEGKAADNIEGFLKETKLTSSDLSSIFGEDFSQEPKLGQLNLDVLKKRTNIPKPIRQLLGEYSDPRINFVKSATKMHQLIYNTKLLKYMLETGKGQWLFDKADAKLGAVVPVAGEQTETYSPLNGLYTFPETMQALKDAMGKETMSEAYKTILRYNSYIKMNKTVLSPTTQFRNWLANIFLAIKNAHFAPGAFSDSLKMFTGYIGNSKKWNDYVIGLKEKGVLGDQANAQEMYKLMEDASVRMRERKIKGGIRGHIAGFVDLAGRMYQYGDDFWKAYGFFAEKQALMKYMPEAQADKEAVKRIRDLYPTYSMTGRMIQKLRRFPIVGSFVSFPAEIIRTSMNTVSYIGKDWKEGRRALAAKRMVGASVAAASAYAMQEFAKGLLDIDEDEEEGYRQMMPWWSENSNVVFLGKDKKGNMKYLDLSFIDPLAYLKKPINAVMRDIPVEEKMWGAFSEAFDPFFGMDIGAGALMEVWTNTTSWGGKVRNPEESWDKQTGDVGYHLWKAIQPGFMANATRVYKAANKEMTSYGKQHTLEDEAAAFLGFRSSTVDPRFSLSIAANKLRYEWLSDAEKTLRDVLRDPNKVSDKELQSAVDDSVKAREAAMRRLSKILAAARKAGLSTMQATATLKGSGISKRDIRTLLAGEIPAWKPSNRKFKSALDKLKQTVPDRYEMLTERRLRALALIREK